jgi:ribosome-binding ATPase YchF (GTP1/OBG family)
VKAAGKVHSDIERGFIRAEIARYQDLVTLGSMHAIKEKGLLKIEGKDAIIEDGDIINFRFNV